MKKNQPIYICMYLYIHICVCYFYNSFPVSAVSVCVMPHQSTDSTTSTRPIFSPSGSLFLNNAVGQKMSNDVISFVAT